MKWQPFPELKFLREELRDTEFKNKKDLRDDVFQSLMLQRQKPHLGRLSYLPKVTLLTSNKVIDFDKNQCISVLELKRNNMNSH